MASGRLALGIEMADVFENPVLSTNISRFWANWNLAIKDGLGRVFFNNLKGSVQSTDAKKQVEVIDYSRGAAVDNGLRNRATIKDNSELYVNLVDQSKTVKVVARRKQFIKKAMAALLTFAASGIWHEYVTSSFIY